MTPGITLTGADERTSVQDLIRLADLGAEIGLLYTYSPDCRHRYPSLEWIGRTAAALDGRVALHVCGHRARSVLSGRNLQWLLACCCRVQVNGRVSPDALTYLLNVVMPPDTTLITQHTLENTDLLGVTGWYRCVKHAVLVDASGGLGQLPKQWVRPETPNAVGFAGGLGPETLAAELPKIAAVATGDWWVDMESRLRDENDWFDINKAIEVMEIWLGFKGKTP